jgi:hypothetical protein
MQFLLSLSTYGVVSDRFKTPSGAFRGRNLIPNAQKRFASDCSAIASRFQRPSKARFGVHQTALIVVSNSRIGADRRLNAQNAPQYVGGDHA